MNGAWYQRSYLSARDDGSERGQHAGNIVHPSIDQDMHTLFLRQIGQTAPLALHAIS